MNINNKILHGHAIGGIKIFANKVNMINTVNNAGKKCTAFNCCGKNV